MKTSILALASVAVMFASAATAAPVDQHPNIANASAIELAEPTVSALVVDSSWARITELTSGALDQHLRIKLNSTFQNPSACAGTDSYIVPYNIGANQQITAMAITAYSMKHQVQLSLDGCYLDRPRVVGISIKE